MLERGQIAFFNFHIFLALQVPFLLLLSGDF